MHAFFRDLNRRIWGPSLVTLPRPQAAGLKALRITIALARDWWEGAVPMRATSLVYTSMLSMVPLLAFAFSVVKAFGVHDVIAPLLNHLLAPLGTRGTEVAQRILEFVQNMRVGVLGSLGLLFLLYTVLSLIGQIEDSLNFIWRVSELRTLSQRFSKYLSVLLVGPVLVVSALGITASIGNAKVTEWLLTVHPFGAIAYVLGQILPYVLVASAFTFIYVLMPNTRVRFASALAGGVAAGVLWQLAGLAFTALVVGSTRYAAIYSSFAILIMFFIWLYIGWLILLMGASVSFYFQCPEYLRFPDRQVRLSARVKEKLALIIMCLIGTRYQQWLKPWTVAELAAHLDVPTEAVNAVLEPLEAAHLLLRTAHDPAGFVPGRALDTIGVSEVLDLVRAAEETGGIAARRLVADEKANELSTGIDAAIRGAAGSTTVLDLMDDESPPGNPR